MIDHITAKLQIFTLFGVFMTLYHVAVDKILKVLCALCAAAMGVACLFILFGWIIEKQEYPDRTIGSDGAGIEQYYGGTWRQLNANLSHNHKIIRGSEFIIDLGTDSAKSVGTPHQDFCRPWNDPSETYDQSLPICKHAP